MVFTTIIVILTVMVFDSSITNAQTLDPCKSYQDVGETDTVHEIYFRKTPLITNDVQECDLLTPTTGWYRPQFRQASDLSTTCADRIKCGTIYPVWMTEAIPEVSDGVVNRTVCRRVVGDCCACDWTIEVKNCGHYRVYRLSPVDVCPAAYCFATPQNKQKNLLLDHVIIGGTAVVFVFSAVSVAVTCLYRRHRMKKLRSMWARKREAARQNERSAPYVIGQRDNPEKSPNMFTTTIEVPYRLRPETPRAWEDVMRIEKKVPL